MTVTSEEFFIRYPAFDGEDEELVDAIINESYLDLPVETWKIETTRGRAALALTAHVLSLERFENLELGVALKVLREGENLKAENLLDRDRSYYKQSVAGREFLRLASRTIGMAAFVP